jgi:hypothetical protein
MVPAAPSPHPAAGNGTNAHAPPDFHIKKGHPVPGWLFFIVFAPMSLKAEPNSSVGNSVHPHLQGGLPVLQSQPFPAARAFCSQIETPCGA